VCQETIENFVKEQFYLSDLGKKHLEAFLYDISEEKLIYKNIDVINQLMYRSYFVLWMSPYSASQFLVGKYNKFIVRTSTTQAGKYTISFYYNMNEINDINHVRYTAKQIVNAITLFKNTGLSGWQINPTHTEDVHYGYM